MKNNSKTITISTKKGKVKIPKAQIVFCQEFIVGTLLTLKNNKSYLLKENIGELKYYLSETQFFIPNNETIINLHYFEALFANDIILKTGKRFKLLEDRKSHFFKRLNLQETIVNENP
jgi:hypothetical protein